jgi:hypothetical protein
MPISFVVHPLVLVEILQSAGSSSYQVSLWNLIALCANAFYGSGPLSISRLKIDLGRFLERASVTAL